jgi:hypothetical protein
MRHNTFYKFIHCLDADEKACASPLELTCSLSTWAADTVQVRVNSPWRCRNLPMGSVTSQVRIEWYLKILSTWKFVFIAEYLTFLQCRVFGSLINLGTLNCSPV